MLVHDPTPQELSRRVVAERGVTATLVVEDPYVIEQIGARGAISFIRRGLIPREHYKSSLIFFAQISSQSSRVTANLSQNSRLAR